MIYKRNLFALYVLIIPLIIFYYCYISEIYYMNFFTVILLISVALTLKILYKNKNGLVIVYLLYLTLSCAGIPIVELFTDEPLKKLAVNTSWYYINTKDKAILISYIFVIIYCLFSLFLTSIIGKEGRGINDIYINESFNKKYFVLGAILSIAFLAFLLYQFVTGRLPLFSTYQDYFSVLNNIKYYGTFIFLYAIAIVCIFTSISKQQLRLGIIIISLPAILLLITGNRGEVFYPLLAGIGILLIRGLKINYRLISIVGMIFFLIIPLVKEVRNLENYNEVKSIGISIADPFLTIGYTLRPIVYTVDWIENDEKFAKGESFYVPFQRGIANNIPGLKPIEYEGKSYNYRERLPTMGYSIIAETYHNFGLWGQFIIIPIILCLLIIGELGHLTSRMIISGGIAAILINNIRNAFSFVPGQIIMLLFLIFIYNVIWYLVVKRRKKINVFTGLYITNNK